MKDNYTYPAIMSENEVGGMDIIFPDFNNATTCAAKGEDAVEAAQDFLVLMIAHFVHRMYQKNKMIKPYFIAFTVITVLLFIMFYPVISGFPVDGDYVREYLRWLPSWQLIG